MEWHLGNLLSKQIRGLKITLFEMAFKKEGGVCQRLGSEDAGLYPSQNPGGLQLCRPSQSIPLQWEGWTLAWRKGLQAGEFHFLVRLRRWHIRAQHGDFVIRT